MIALGTLSALVVAAPAHAAAQLDQSSIPTGSISFAAGVTLNPDQINTQTFTAGLNGRLEKLDLALSSIGQAESSLAFRLERASGEVLFSKQISASSVSASALDGWYASPIDLSAANILVKAGDQLRLVLTSGPETLPSTFAWFYLTNGVRFSYAGGESSLGSRWDYGFRTYVDTSAVPEPATWALMIVGFGGAGLALRRVNRRSLQAA